MCRSQVMANCHVGRQRPGVAASSQSQAVQSRYHWLEINDQAIEPVQFAEGEVWILMNTELYVFGVLIHPGGQSATASDQSDEATRMIQ